MKTNAVNTLEKKLNIILCSDPADWKALDAKENYRTLRRHHIHCVWMASTREQR